ncbi:hypothetical protein BDF14DRAFT_1348957 [Spinellus fusiger]|nr:hypothetical protein BDF14DRAFT_1348957 [Spinellus fusiger]
MKFTVSLSLIALAASASAAFIPRQEQTQTLQDNASLYPAGTDLSILNGNWHVTGLSSNIYSTVYSLADSKGLSLTCPQSFVNSVSSGNVEITASTFIKHRVVDEVAGVNVTSSELYVLQPPSDYIDVNDHQFSFLFQTSQWFADGAKWDTLTGAAAQDQGVIAIPGFPETTSKVNAKLISSQNDGAFDTVFLWLDPTSASGPAIEKRHAHSKRCGHKKPLIQGPSYNSTITTHDGTTDTWSGSSHSGSSHSGSSTETSHSGSSESGSTETSHSALPPKLDLPLVLPPLRLLLLNLALPQALLLRLLLPLLLTLSMLPSCLVLLLWMMWPSTTSWLPFPSRVLIPKSLLTGSLESRTLASKPCSIVHQNNTLCFPFFSFNF